MPRTDRLFRLLDTLRRLPPPVTAARLAAETEVSTRAIYRDIAALRVAGARIDGAAGYGYSLTEDPGLPPATFTRTEVEALVLGLAEVRHSGDPALADAAETALSKVVATLPERRQREATHAVLLSYRYTPRLPPRIDMAVVRTACWDERALEIAYLNKEGAESRRLILPLTLVFLDRTQMLLAWCCLRQDFRQFRLDRVVSVTATGDSFRPRRVTLLRTYLAKLAGRD